MVRLLALALLAATVPASAQASEESTTAFVVSPPAPERPAEADRYDVDAAPAYYVVGREVVVREAPSDEARSVATLRTRDGVRVLDAIPADTAAADTLGWRLVHTDEGRGYVRPDALSNVWIRVAKGERVVYVYRGSELVRELPADVSINGEDKVRRSALGEQEHYRMPEGTFFVTRLHDTSQYYLAFVLSYPNPAHARRGLEAGIISQAQYEAILRADEAALEPPMNTPLGGLIEIHGHGSGRQRAWTRGCVALRNVHMDELWAYVQVGTPVVIEP